MSSERLAQLIGDYRAHEIEPIDAAHITTWADQLQPGVREDVVDELCHVFEKTYWSREKCLRALGAIAASSNLTGNDPHAFWQQAQLLNIQIDGNSQREILPLFQSKVAELFGPNFRCGSVPGERYVYLDDGLFSGGRARADLQAWIATRAPNRIELHCIFFVTHAYGAYSLKTAIQRSARDAGKQIQLKIWHGLNLENRRARRDSSDVLWPITLPDDPDVHAYEQRIASLPFLPRSSQGNYRSPYFSSSQRRRLLEEQFSLVGSKIVMSCAAPSAVIRPLGFYNFGFGFGSLFVSFRNCPNNAPLALWWGVPTAGGFAWTPLFKRKTYAGN